jgi:hypothetical protein
MMSVHWMHVAAAYALVAGGFLALGIGATLRLRAARRRLLALDPRGGAAARWRAEAGGS